MVFWLILILSGGLTADGIGRIPDHPYAMHVGTYTSLEACEAAAKEAKLIPAQRNGLAVVGGFVCVRSSQTTPSN